MSLLSLPQSIVLEFFLWPMQQIRIWLFGLFETLLVPFGCFENSYKYGDCHTSSRAKWHSTYLIWLAWIVPFVIHLLQSSFSCSVSLILSIFDTHPSRVEDCVCSWIWYWIYAMESIHMFLFPLKWNLLLWLHISENSWWNTVQIKSLDTLSMKWMGSCVFWLVLVHLPKCVYSHVVMCWMKNIIISFRLSQDKYNSTPPQRDPVFSESKVQCYFNAGMI